jgi:LacI family transcriptional regulator
MLLYAEMGQDLLSSLPSIMPVVGLMAPLVGRPSILADDFGGSKLAVEHLLQLGHRRIGYMGIVAAPPVRRRIEGYQAALHSHGITPDPAWLWATQGYNYNRNQYARENMRMWLTESWSELGITAILTQNDRSAIAVEDVLRERGIRVPEDVSVVGFDGTEHGEFGHPPVTSIDVSLRKIGDAATRLLLRAMAGEHVEVANITLPAQLVRRASTGARV